MRNSLRSDFGMSQDILSQKQMTLIQRKVMLNFFRKEPGITIWYLLMQDIQKTI